MHLIIGIGNILLGSFAFSSNLVLLHERGIDFSGVFCCCLGFACILCGSLFLTSNSK